MKHCIRVALVAGILLSQQVSAQIPPKREFRAAWIATVLNLDWPSTRGGDPQVQRNQLITILDGLKAAGINAVIFQVRSECDAMYPSTIEPWSYWLTGQQGSASILPFDPLQFVLQEAHLRGMEVHAWFNPYRAERSVGNYVTAGNHVVNANSDWILTFGTLKMLDPGIPGAREHVMSVIADVVRRYDVDGVHWDDYFYPYSGITNQDSLSWALYNRGFSNRADWRRDNVNILVRGVYDSIQVIRPRTKFGISPFGIWKSGNPAGIVGTSAYDALYCDALAWLNGGYIDYLTPQLYWPFGGGQDYAKLMPWWAGEVAAKGKHFYPGQAPYRITDDNWGASELPNQIRLNRSTPGSRGSVFFRARYGVTNNPKGFADSLKNDLYKYPALRPVMTWKETTPPNAPTGLTINKLTSSAVISWTAPTIATDGELASQYVLYRSVTLPIDLNDPRNIVTIQTNTNPFEQPLPPPGVTHYYAVTGLDRLDNESPASNIMGLTSSGVVGIEAESGTIASYRLHQNFPNPFNPTTVIRFQLPKEQQVTIRVYDILGREVRTLFNGIQRGGEHQVFFDASGLPTGVYIYRLVAGDYVESRKMQLVR